MLLPSSYLITNAVLINEGRMFEGSLLVEDGHIAWVKEGSIPFNGKVIDLAGKWLLPGVIDDQVHFREPGLTHKAEILTESAAAAAGGVTSFMEMPNTMPQTLSQQALEDKYRLGAKRSLVNYSFYMGVSNDNLDEVLRTPPEAVCGIKVFLGASTGNMLVDNPETLYKLFASAPMIVAAHCENEPLIASNLARFKEKYGENIPIEAHPLIRSAESCYLSSSFAVGLAHELGTRLHVLHLSTAAETALFDSSIPLREKRITAEVCVHHLFFDDSDYADRGNYIKWNPSIKTAGDRQGLRQALIDGSIDVVATDHAPHTLEEKAQPYLKCPSGGPMVQHSLPLMLDMAAEGLFNPAFVVEKMCHAPSELFRLDRRGYLREGYHADLAIVDPSAPQLVSRNTLFYKCGWSPIEGHTLKNTVIQTIVNGSLVYSHGRINPEIRGQRLRFNR
jgi:dihydroorotase